MNSKEIGNLIIEKYKHIDICLPNYYYDGFEADVFRLTSKGQIVEYEIKLTKADFWADFKKSYKNSKKELVVKHDSLKNGLRCNRFSFVVPSGLIDISDIPDYCGLIYVEENGLLKTIKNARLLHKESVNDSFYKYLSSKLYWRLKDANYEIKKLKSQLNIC